MSRTPPTSPGRTPKVETPVHQSSRRLQGLPPECGPLPDHRPTRSVSLSAMNPPVLTTPVLLNHQRDPPHFHGLPHEDAEDWLEQFDRVAAFNAWNADSKLRHVYFALEDSARTWFENQEAGLRTWDTFKAEFLRMFTNTLRKEKAQLLLNSRIQHPNETVTAYAEEMKRLFRRADPTMSEEKKVRFLMQGVKEQLFAGLVRSPPTTVAEFISEASTIEKALDMRARQYQRTTVSMNAASAGEAVQFSSESLRDTIRAIVREEVAKYLRIPPQPQVATVSDIIREEVQQALGVPAPVTVHAPVTGPAPVAAPEPVVATPLPQTLSYAAVTSRYLPPSTASYEPRAPVAHVSSRPSVRRRRTDIWRTPDHQPLCYHCGEAGHLCRRCPYRELGLRGFSFDARRPLPGQQPREIAEYISRSNTGPSRLRSPSPRRYSSPGRQEQLQSPHRGN